MTPIRERWARWVAVVAASVTVASGCAAPIRAANSPVTPLEEPAAPPQTPVTVPNLEPCTRVSRLAAPASSTEQRLLDLDLPCLIAGPAVNPAQLGGRPVIVNLWATWCQPCREEMPLLQAAHLRYKNRVQFIGVNTKDRPDWAGEFLQQVGVTYPEVVDADGRLLASLRSPGLPVTVVLSRDGRIAGSQIGRISEQRLTTLIDGVTG